MPRRNRCFVALLPYHITQRGVDRVATFTDDSDRLTWVALLRDHLQEAGVQLLGWCLMTNHIHLVAVPEREDGLSVLSRRVNGRYAQYYNVHRQRSGHLWQNRFFACALGPAHLWTVLAYVDLNPVRAAMVKQAGDYRWSSAQAHRSGVDPHGILDMDWWARHAPPNWSRVLAAEGEKAADQIRRCTYAGRPFGDEDFTHMLGERFGRKWTPGRPKKRSENAALHQPVQPSLFAKTGT